MDNHGGEENCIIILVLCDNAISVPEFSSASVLSLLLCSKLVLV